MTAWIVETACFEPELPLYAIELRRSLWYALGVEAETADFMAEQLQIYYCDGRLILSERFQQVADWVGVVAAVLQGLNFLLRDFFARGGQAEWRTKHRILIFPDHSFQEWAQLDVYRGEVWDDLANKQWERWGWFLL